MKIIDGESSVLASALWFIDGFGICNEQFIGDIERKLYFCSDMSLRELYFIWRAVRSYIESGEYEEPLSECEREFKRITQILITAERKEGNKTELNLSETHAEGGGDEK